MRRGRLLLPAPPTLLLALGLLLLLVQAGPAHARPSNGVAVASCKPGERYAPDACNECECRNERNPERFDFVCSRRVCLDVNPDIGFLLRR
ncbi:hypothetical protein R5R35_006466 [Gryllus longicercus]|uniref:Pacifastin domain-containing protein n=1 Tax=Gryllus longicercus TaxID=2509291 RepID=A0AAN9W023_9ORTH